MNEADLRAKGFVKQPDGSWNKPGWNTPEGRTVDRVGGLRNPVAQQDFVSTDASPVRRQAGRTSGVVGGGRPKQLRVTITRLGRRVLDRDNLQGGAKHLRDAIANSLGRDDAERHGIEWCYNQVQTRGPVGTLVQIEQL